MPGWQNVVTWKTEWLADEMHGRIVWVGVGVGVKNDLRQNDFRQSNLDRMTLNPMPLD